jgi:hypothetical protein
MSKSLINMRTSSSKISFLVQLVPSIVLTLKLNDKSFLPISNKDFDHSNISALSTKITWHIKYCMILRIQTYNLCDSSRNGMKSMIEE